MKEDGYFGGITGVKEGQIFKNRRELSRLWVHKPVNKTIHYSKHGVYSIIISPIFKVREVDKYHFYYAENNATKNGEEISNALIEAIKNQHRIRIIRSSTVSNGPQNGFRYDGLFRVSKKDSEFKFSKITPAKVLDESRICDLSQVEPILRPLTISVTLRTPPEPVARKDSTPVVDLDVVDESDCDSEIRILNQTCDEVDACAARTFNTNITEDTTEDTITIDTTETIQEIIKDEPVKEENLDVDILERLRAQGITEDTILEIEDDLMVELNRIEPTSNSSYTSHEIFLSSLKNILSCFMTYFKLNNTTLFCVKSYVKEEEMEGETIIHQTEPDSTCCTIHTDVTLFGVLKSLHSGLSDGTCNSFIFDRLQEVSNLVRGIEECSNEVEKNIKRQALQSTMFQIISDPHQQNLEIVTPDRITETISHDAFINAVKGLIQSLETEKNDFSIKPVNPGTSTDTMPSTTQENTEIPIQSWPIYSRDSDNSDEEFLGVFSENFITSAMKRVHLNRRERRKKLRNNERST